MQPARRLASTAAAAAVLAVPTILAFFSGGFFDQPRLWAALGLWALVAVLAAVGAVPRPSRAAWAALGGLALLTALTAASLAWAPVAGGAQDDYQRLLLYLAALFCAFCAFSRPGPARVAEPILAAGVAAVCLYALSARLAPGVIEQAVGESARGRLDQPLTYWNALGILSAMGLLLTARLAGDGSRASWLRAGAAAVSPAIALSLYLTFSRGSLAALGIGILALALFSPSRDDLRGMAVVVATTVAAAMASELPGLSAVSQPASSRGGGLAMAAVLVVLGVVAAALVVRDARRSRETPGPPLLAGARTGVVLGAAALAVVLVLVAGAGGEQHGGADVSGAKRLSNVQSNRYDYWRVAVDTAVAHPLAGTGSSSFAVEWLRERDVDERVVDAHSLYLETAAELGVAGLICLALFLGGLLAAARRALTTERALAAGPAALLTAWAMHAGMDWDWEMPAVTLVMLAAGGLLLGVSARRAD